MADRSGDPGDPNEPDSHLARRLGVGHAVVIGLGSMIGAGIFAALDPAAEAAGGGLLVGLAVAGLVAYRRVGVRAGVSRTMFAMAADRELPGWLDAVHPRRRVPHRAELVVGATVAVLVVAVDLRTAIGFSSFAVLGYCGLTNASALTLAAGERRWPRPLAGFGLVGCGVLAVSLPLLSVVSGGAVLAAGAAVWWVRHRR